MDTLRQGYRNLMRHLYAPGPYYQRVRTFLREYRPPRVRASFRWSDVRTFVHSSLRLGVFGRECVHYWGLLLWTLFHRPALFHLAVTFAIYGHHFRRTCRTLGP